MLFVVVGGEVFDEHLFAFMGGESEDYVLFYTIQFRGQDFCQT